MGEQESLPQGRLDKLPPIIGLRGEIGSGKDTAATWLAFHFGYGIIGFSDPVYESLYRLNPPVLIAHHRCVYLQTLVDKDGWDTTKRRYPAVRQMLRTIGTENGRDIFGPWCWVNIAKQRTRARGLPRYAFRDVRFPEEVEHIKSEGGEIWEIQGRVSEEVATLPSHRSEQQQLAVDRIVLNDGSLPQFQRRITEIMRGFLR
jgi:hypothetical protein